PPANRRPRRARGSGTGATTAATVPLVLHWSASTVHLLERLLYVAHRVHLTPCFAYSLSLHDFAKALTSGAAGMDAHGPGDIRLGTGIGRETMGRGCRRRDLPRATVSWQRRGQRTWGIEGRRSCTMRICLISVPLDLGANRHGVDMGPSAIRYADIDDKLR